MTPSRATRIDVIAGGLVTAIAASSLWQAADLDSGTLRSFGPGMLPTVLASVLLVCGIALLLTGLLRNERTAEHFQAALRGPGCIGLAVLVFAVTVEGMELGGLTLPRWGVAIAGPLTVILAGYASVEAHLRDLAAAGLGLTAFCLALFNDLLGMDLPVGPLMLETALAGTLGGDGILRGAYLISAALAALLALRRPAPCANA
jgi:hypothetical protein